MQGIHLKISKSGEKLALGQSKLLGNPDVWDGFEWPYVEENGERYDLAFICQINCAQAAGLDKDGRLPQTGMLYFFYDLDAMPEAPDGRSARVIRYNGDLSALHEMVLTDEEGGDLSFLEQKAAFVAGDAADMADVDTGAGCLATLLPEGAPPAADAPAAKGASCAGIGGWTPLLRLNSFETEDAKIRFKDGGALCFYIKPEKLAAQDFSDVRAAQIKADFAG